MSRSVYILDIAVAALGIGVYLHVSDHDGKYVTRAEFDKHLAAIRVDLERLGLSGSDVVRMPANVKHVGACIPSVPDLHDGYGPSADVGDNDALARASAVPKIVWHHASCDAEVYADAATIRPDSVANDGVDEVRELDDCANGDKDGGDLCFFPWRTLYHNL